MRYLLSVAGLTAERLFGGSPIPTCVRWLDHHPNAPRTCLEDGITWVLTCAVGTDQLAYQLGHEAVHVARNDEQDGRPSWVDEMLAETVSVLALESVGGAWAQYALGRRQDAEHRRADIVGIDRLESSPDDLDDYYGRLRRAGLSLHRSIGLDGLALIAQAGKYATPFQAVHRLSGSARDVVRGVLGASA